MLRGLAVGWLAWRKRKSGGIRVRCSHLSKLLVRLVSVANGALCPRVFCSSSQLLSTPYYKVML